MQCYNNCLPQVKEDWVLVIDLDEFLYINPFRTIQDYLETIDVSVGQIQFPWLNLMSDQYCHGSVFEIIRSSKKFTSDHMKSMARRTCCSWLGIHAHDTKGMKTVFSSGVETNSSHRHPIFFDDTDYYYQHPFILHFCSRGHFDILTRIIDQQFFNSKCGPQELNRVRNYLVLERSWSSIPARCLLMLFYFSLPAIDIHIEIPSLESGNQIDDLKKIFLRNINKIIEFEVTDLDDLETHFEDAYQFSGKFSLHGQPAVGNLKDYLQRGCQLGYIDQLRKFLVNENYS
jgi:hypothetical protein